MNLATIEQHDLESSDYSVRLFEVENDAKLLQADGHGFRAVMSARITAK